MLVCLGFALGLVLRRIRQNEALACLAGRREWFAPRHGALDAGASATRAHDLILTGARGSLPGLVRLTHFACPFLPCMPHFWGVPLRAVVTWSERAEFSRSGTGTNRGHIAKSGCSSRGRTGAAAGFSSGYPRPRRITGNAAQGARRGEPAVRDVLGGP